LLPGPETTRGLDDYVHVVVAPAHVPGLRLLARDHGDPAPLGEQEAAARRDLLLELAVDRVEVEEVGDARRLRHVGYRADLDVLAAVDDAEDVAAEPAEAVESDANGQGARLPS